MNNKIILIKNGESTKSKGSDEFFTGEVDIEYIMPSNDTSHFSIGYVTFQKGARTAWHTHPKGQHLIVIEGVGLVQEEGRPIREIKTGDTVYCPPNVKHWHGASLHSYMKHIAITGDDNGKSVFWMDKVTDEEYNKYNN